MVAAGAIQTKRRAMLDFRFMVAVAALFAVSFFGVRWLAAGAPVPLPTVTELKPDARLPTFHRYDPRTDRKGWVETKTSQGDNDPDRDKLREAVIAAATAYLMSPCNEDFRREFLAGAGAYARAFQLAVGCERAHWCVIDDARREQAVKAFGSPYDKRVKEAIARVHGMGTIARDDYADGYGYVVAMLAGRGFDFPDQQVPCGASARR
jgi:hypothetical protein